MNDMEEEDDNHEEELSINNDLLHASDSDDLSSDDSGSDGSIDDDSNNEDQEQEENEQSEMELENEETENANHETTTNGDSGRSEPSYLIQWYTHVKNLPIRDRIRRCLAKLKDLSFSYDLGVVFAFHGREKEISEDILLRAMIEDPSLAVCEEYVLIEGNTDRSQPLMHWLVEVKADVILLKLIHILDPNAYRRHTTTTTAGRRYPLMPLDVAQNIKAIAFLWQLMTESEKKDFLSRTGYLVSNFEKLFYNSRCTVQDRREVFSLASAILGHDAAVRVASCGSMLPWQPPQPFPLDHLQFVMEVCLPLSLAVLVVDGDDTTEFWVEKDTMHVEVNCDDTFPLAVKQLLTLHLKLSTLDIRVLKKSSLRFFPRMLSQLAEQQESERVAVQRFGLQSQQQFQFMPPPSNNLSDVTNLVVQVGRYKDAKSVSNFFDALALHLVNVKRLCWDGRNVEPNRRPAVNTLGEGLLKFTSRLENLEIASLPEALPIVSKFLTSRSENLHFFGVEGYKPFYSHETNATQQEVDDINMIKLCDALAANTSITRLHLNVSVSPISQERLVHVFQRKRNTTVKDYTGCCEREIRYWVAMRQVEDELLKPWATKMDVIKLLQENNGEYDDSDNEDILSNAAAVYGLLRCRPDLWCN